MSENEDRDQHPLGQNKALEKSWAPSLTWPIPSLQQPKRLNQRQWFGEGDPQLPLHKQGLTVLGVPVGQPEFVVAELTAKAEGTCQFVREDRTHP